MTDEQLSKVTKYKVLHFPTVLGGVVPTYNVPGAADAEFLRPDAGRHLSWARSRNGTMPALKKDNPGVKLPNEDITVVHRSDGSGTTFVFTDYLSKVSPEWKSKVGANTSVNWPVGLGGKGNEGVAGLVKQTPNSIGYVELIYAVQNKMEYGAVKNAAGNFRQGGLRHRYRSGRGRGQEHAGRFPRFHHQRSGQECLSDFHLHLAADSEQNRRCHQEKVDRRFPDSGC